MPPLNPPPPHTFFLEDISWRLHEVPPGSKPAPYNYCLYLLIELGTMKSSIPSWVNFLKTGSYNLKDWMLTIIYKIISLLCYRIGTRRK